jgi:hypothetical protein
VTDVKPAVLLRGRKGQLCVVLDLGEANVAAVPDGERGTRHHNVRPLVVVPEAESAGLASSAGREVTAVIGVGLCWRQ